jgi:Spy/CpxP family protein refolding chaperone
MENNSVQQKAGILVVAVFLLGAVLGGVGIHYWEAGAYGGHSISGYPKHAEIIKQLTLQVGLTADQEKQVAAVIDDVRTRMHELSLQQKPQVDAIRADGRQRIRALLTPEQQPKYEKFLKELDADRANAESQR